MEKKEAKCVRKNGLGYFQYVYGREDRRNENGGRENKREEVRGRRLAGLLYAENRKGI